VLQEDYLRPVTVVFEVILVFAIVGLSLDLFLVGKIWMKLEY
jgi:hypothetical protein